MSEENQHIGAVAEIDRRTYIKSGAFTLGTLSIPLSASREASARSRELPHSISIVSDDGRRAFYRFTISERIEARWQADLSNADYPDGVEGRTAFGSVAERGADNFHFAGEITNFVLSGPATVYMNGDEIDVKERWGPSLPQSLVITSESDQRASYEFDVSGTIEPGAVADLSSGTHTDTVDDGSAIGWVAEGGADNYFFSGNLTHFSYTGPLSVRENDQQVDPDSLGSRDSVPVQIETIVTNLEVPWGTAFHGNTLYLTERPGRIVRINSGAREVVADLTDETRAKGEGGLLGLVFHPRDPDTAYAYQTYTNESRPANRILEIDVTDGFVPSVLFDGIPGANRHDGGRLATDGDTLYATVGDADDPAAAQDPSTLNGSVLRLTFDGEPHPNNPFDNAVFSYGHRNPQGLAFHDGRLYSTEHGPDHDDEINILEAGLNYGWPDVMGTSGGEYADPIATYTPTIAPGSLTFYDGPITQWQNEFFFGTLAGEHLHRARIRGSTVVDQERLYVDEYDRLRTVFTGPDNHLYVTTSNRDGPGTPISTDDRLLRIRPK